MSNIDTYAVFGHPIKHSKSPYIHKLFAEQTQQDLIYSSQDVTAEAFTDTVQAFFAAGGKGLNCTVPLKELAWQLADKNTPRADYSKAVNTLALQSDGSILGDNTDGIGLLNDLTVNHEINLKNTSILILGAGGATRGILAPLLEQTPNKLVIANRTVAKAIQLSKEFAHAQQIEACGFADLQNLQFDLIINATSASLSNALPPLPDTILKRDGSCYDLAYANQATTFVQWGQQHHAKKSIDGLGMLVEQAADAFFLWRGIRPQTAPVIALLEAERKLTQVNQAGLST